LANKVDGNLILMAYLKAQASLTALVSTRIFCPQLIGKTLPSISFSTRGGPSDAYKPIIDPSIQFSCWADDAIEARHVYNVLHGILTGIENQAVVIASDILHGSTIVLPAGTYYILSALEEVQAQDLQDIEPPNFYKVLAFFQIKMR